MSKKGYKIVSGMMIIIVVGFSVALAQMSSDFALRTTPETPENVVRSAAALSNIFELDTRTAMRESAAFQTQIGGGVHGAARTYLSGSALSNNFAVNTIAPISSSPSEARLSTSTLSIEFTLDTTR